MMTTITIIAIIMFVLIVLAVLPWERCAEYMLNKKLDPKKEKRGLPKFKNPPPPPPKTLGRTRDFLAACNLWETLHNSDLPAYRRDRIIEAILDNLKDDTFKSILQLNIELQANKEAEQPHY